MNKRTAGLLALLLCGFQFCATAEEHALAVLPVENAVLPQKMKRSDLHLFLVDRDYDYLSRAVTDMLMTELFERLGPRLLERVRVEELAGEIRLAETGLISDESAQKVGKALGAKYLLAGTLSRRRGRFVAQPVLLDRETRDEDMLGDFSWEEGGAVDAVRSLAEKATKALGGKTDADGGPGIPKGATISILTFNDNSPSHEWESLRGVLPERLTSELAEIPTLTFVERARLDALLGEMKLSLSGYIDERTAVKVGKMLGAQYIILGSIFADGGTLRLDARMTQVETGRTACMASASGDAAEPKSVSQLLAKRLREKLRKP